MTRHVTRMSIFDALHYTPKQQQELIESYPKHVRGARAMGRPSVGEGAVFPIEDEDIMCAPFRIPSHWQEIGGLDFGWDHPTAAIRLVFEREAETFYVVQEYRKRQMTPMMHCENLRAWGPHLPFAWGMEGLQTKLAENPQETWKIFRKHRLKMLDVHATFHNGGVGVERGVTEILELMMAGRFKVFSSCKAWFEEKSTYHRKRRSDSAVAQIVKVHDDLMDATRYAYMMLRYSVPASWRPEYGGKPRPSTAGRGRPIDSRDIFGGK